MIAEIDAWVRNQAGHKKQAPRVFVTEDSAKWGGQKRLFPVYVLKSKHWAIPFMTDMLKHNGPSVTDTLSSGESRSAHAPPGFSPNGQTNYKMYQKKHIVLL